MRSRFCPLRVALPEAFAMAAVWALLATLSGSHAPAAELVFTQVPVTEVPPETPSNGLFLPPRRPSIGSRIVLYDPSIPGNGVTNLTPEFAAAADPDVSFDGNSILFSGKKAASDPWDIWEKPIVGGEARRITDGVGNCREPIYTGILNTLNAPEWDQIVFISDHHGTWNEDGSGPSTALYSCKIDGTEVHRLTYNLSSDFAPFCLHDGRILFTSWQRTGNRFPPDGTLPLMTVFTDGTDLMPFFGNHERPILRHQAAESPDRYVYLIESSGGYPWGGGDLARVSLRRPLYTREVVADDALYLSPSVSPDGDVLISSREPRTGSNYGISTFDPETGSRGETVFDDPDFHDVDPKFALPRPKPRGRSTVVTYGKDTGWFFCLDAYLSDRPEGQSVKPGDIRRVRLIEGIPPAGKDDVKQPTGLDGGGADPVYDRRRIVADFPIDEDGSVSVRTPILTPLQFQTVDKDGLSLQTCQTWLWVMPMERNGCIGCHEDREMTPPNRFVEAAQRPPRDVALPPDKRRTVDFRRDVMPLIDKNCAGAGCHDKGARLDFSGAAEPAAVGESGAVFNRAYAGLITGTDVSGQPYVLPGASGDSLLARRLAGRDGRPSHPDPPLSEFDRMTFIEWIDLGARWRNLEEDVNTP